MKFTLFCVLLMASTATVLCRPQDSDAPEPYETEYKVEDAESQNYFGANENGDAAGKVTGKYYVLLPDGRLMTVEYTVDGESGFVPKISFQENASPFGKK